MRISKATRKFENWLGRRLPLVQADLDLKHKLMAERPLTFLRGTYYRWAQLWPELCPELANAPEVLAVGDLHIENFGTWRDREGRLVWGVNDFDEAYTLPYTNDLVRLAASAHLAVTSRRLKIEAARGCKAILDGYNTCLKGGGRPIVLEEHHGWLWNIATSDLRDPHSFWSKMDALPRAHDVPKSARKALEGLMPEEDLDYKIAHRVSGVGSLGCERFVALAEWQGGKIAREAKALAPSACVWAFAGRSSRKILYEEILGTSCRAPDPFVRTRGRWLVRRLAPDCSRIELASLPEKVDEERLLKAMGFETANVHFGSKTAMKALRNDLAKRKGGWLHAAARKMAQSIVEDYEDWCKTQP
jgi:hypothetical protein